jgi:hypothetical protein
MITELLVSLVVLGKMGTRLIGPPRLGARLVAAHFPVSRNPIRMAFVELTDALAAGGVQMVRRIAPPRQLGQILVQPRQHSRRRRRLARRLRAVPRFGATRKMAVLAEDNGGTGTEGVSCEAHEVERQLRL